MNLNYHVELEPTKQNAMLASRNDTNHMNRRSFSRCWDNFASKDDNIIAKIYPRHHIMLTSKPYVLLF